MFPILRRNSSTKSGKSEPGRELSFSLLFLTQTVRVLLLLVSQMVGARHL